MILDTSALIAILAGEPEAGAMIDAISRARRRRISAGNALELAIVVAGQFGAEMLLQSDALLHRMAATIEPVTADQIVLARQAYLDFGKGRHRAGLNFGDCFAYALAKSTGEPLLYKGKDFSLTDVHSAM